MSSYNQLAETRSLAETLGLATAEIIELCDELSNLCAAIAAQFPDTHENIPKYQQAYNAVAILDEAREVLAIALERVNPPDRNLSVTVKVGRQTRHNRSMSQTVRLGNAVARLEGVEKILGEADADDDLARDLNDILAELESVSFPARYG